MFADDYVETNRRTVRYEINNFYIENNYIILNGWASTNGHQHLKNDDTHQYSFQLIDRKDNSTKEYIASLKWVDKTQFLRTQTYNRQCYDNEYDVGGSTCYYIYENVGFEVRIPLSDLDTNTEYDIFFRIWEKQVNRKFKIKIYTPNIAKSYNINNVTYQLKSDIANIYAIVTGEPVYVRTGPSSSYAPAKGNIWCSDYYKNEFYWIGGNQYNNIIQFVQNKPNDISSETWINMRFNEGYCSNSRLRAVDGTSRTDGWIAGAYADFTGTPATIVTKRLQNTYVNYIESYTASKDNLTKSIISLNNNISQNVTLNVYKNDILIQSNNYEFNGQKDIEINYNVEDGGELKFEIIETNGFTSLYNSKVYISSEETFNYSDITKTITPSTPIMTYTDKNNNITNCYEKISYEIPHNYIEIINGQGFNAYMNIDYYSDKQSILINDDIYSFIYFPNQENNLNYEIVNGVIKVPISKTNNDVNKVNFELENYYFDNLGVIYKEYNDGYINGNNKWYPNINSELGNYNYYYNVSNIGVNKITINVDCEYKTVKYLIGNNNSKFRIKRVYIPKELNTIFKNNFTYFEFKKYIEGI